MTPRRGVLDADELWEGEVLLDGDVVVPAGVGLTIRAGTRVRFAERARWSAAVLRGAPEGYPIEASRRGLCDLIVLGRLRVEGTAEAPARLDAVPWGGIIALAAADIRIRHAMLAGAPEALLQVFDDSDVELRDVRLSGGAVGVLSWGLSRLRAASCRIEGCGTGVLAREGSMVELRDCELADCAIGAHGQHWALLRAEGGAFRDCREAGAAAYDRSAFDANGTTFSGCGDGALAGGEGSVRLRGCRFRGNRAETRAIEAGRVEARGCASETAASSGAERPELEGELR